MAIHYKRMVRYANPNNKRGAWPIHLLTLFMPPVVVGKADMHHIYGDFTGQEFLCGWIPEYREGPWFKIEDAELTDGLLTITCRDMKGTFKLGFEVTDENVGIHTAEEMCNLIKDVVDTYETLKHAHYTLTNARDLWSQGLDAQIKAHQTREQE